MMLSYQNLLLSHQATLYGVSSWCVGDPGTESLNNRMRLWARAGIPHSPRFSSEEVNPPCFGANVVIIACKIRKHGRSRSGEVAFICLHVKNESSGLGDAASEGV